MFDDYDGHYPGVIKVLKLSDCDALNTAILRMAYADHGTFLLGRGRFFIKK